MKISLGYTNQGDFVSSRMRFDWAEMKNLNELAYQPYKHTSDQREYFS